MQVPANKANVLNLYKMFVQQLRPNLKNVRLQDLIKKIVLQDTTLSNQLHNIVELQQKVIELTSHKNVMHAKTPGSLSTLINPATSLPSFVGRIRLVLENIVRPLVPLLKIALTVGRSATKANALTAAS